MTVALVSAAALISTALWVYLLVGHGRFWAADRRLPPVADGPSPRDGWPRVVVIVPARDEAAVLPRTLPTLLGQVYPGDLRIVLVDDASRDDTAAVARRLATGSAARGLTVVRGAGPPAGWAGKVAALEHGLQVAPESTYVLFTDADIAHPADSVRRLVAHAEAGRFDLVSLMARLRTDTAAERAIVPAFVYSFAQLYPFARVNRPGAHTAAAAGGCMLVRRAALAARGGLARIAGARIDDVALGRLLKQPVDAGGEGGRIWLGLTTEVHSVRAYSGLADLWEMVARSAYVQLRHSPLLLSGTLLGLLLTYAVPPVVSVACLLDLLNGGGNRAALLAIAGVAAWALMALSYLPTLRLYRLGAWRAALLPAVMMVYGAMTLDSARRYHFGRGVPWKGRSA